MSHWIAAARLRTLPAAIAPVVVGTACAHATGGIAWGPALAALGGAIAIQIGTNFANDVFDAEKRRRRPRSRRPGARGRGGPHQRRRDEARDGHRVRGRVRVRPLPHRDRRLADRRDRHRVDHRRHRVHGRPVPARLSRPRRHVRDGVLRLRRGVRHDVRASRSRPVARGVGVDSRRRDRDRDHRRQQRPRSRNRRPRRQAHARGAVRPAIRDRRVRRSARDRVRRSRSGSPSARTRRGARCRSSRCRSPGCACATSSTPRPAPRTTRCSPRPASCCSCTARCSRPAW